MMCYCPFCANKRLTLLATCLAEQLHLALAGKEPTASTVRILDIADRELDPRTIRESICQSDLRTAFQRLQAVAEAPEPDTFRPKNFGGYRGSSN